MWSRTAPTTAGFVLFAVSTAFAQRDTLSSSPRDRLSIVAGFADSQHRDASVSPLTFDGTGFNASGTYEHFSAHSTASIGFAWDAQHLRPRDGAVDASERVLQGAFRAALLRSYGDSRGWMLSAGAAATAWGLGTEHRYDDPDQSRAGFGAVFAAVGPAAQLRRALGGGVAQFDIDAPLFGFSDRSYSVVTSDQGSFNLRRVGPRELGAVNGAVSYAPAPLKALGVVFSYRFSFLNYRDTQPLRSASQSFSIGVSRYFGRGSP
jgi:hypothetical protein